MDNQNTQTTQSSVPVSPTPIAEPQSPPPVTPETPEPPVITTSVHGRSNVKFMLLAVIALLCVIAAGVGGYTYANNKAKTNEAGLNTQIASLQSNEHQLPAGSTKVSDCIPDMGIHYLPKTSDPVYGPFVLTNKEGRVIGLEYMAPPTMYIPIPNTNPPVELIEKNGPLFNWKFDHIEFSHLPLGHEGYMHDHIDVHLYTITAAQEKLACV